MLAGVSEVRARLTLARAAIDFHSEADRIARRKSPKICSRNRGAGNSAASRMNFQFLICCPVQSCCRIPSYRLRRSLELSSCRRSIAKLAS